MYTKISYPCFYQGHWMDSLLELRYVLSIEKTHAWQRDDLQIYFSVNKNSESIKAELRKYTPDFLIRNYQTGEAKLIEIKPQHFKDNRLLIRKKQIDENFIQYFGYDWTFEIVFADQIYLSQEVEKKYHQLIQDFKFGKHYPSPITLSQQASYVSFIREGVLSPEWNK